MHISSQFDSGNIEVVSAQSPDDIRLTIPNDTNLNLLNGSIFV